MNVEEREIKLESHMFSAERDVTRSKGLHLSHVISFILAREQKASKETAEERDDSLQRYAVGGFLWERVLANLIENSPDEMWEWIFSRAMNEPSNPKVVRPGEMEIDIAECKACQGTGAQMLVGVPEREWSDKCSYCHGSGRIKLFMTPDGYNIEEMCLEEWKYTSKSFKGGILGPKFKRWVSYQIPIYLKVLGLNKCKLRVYFARGDYGTTTVVPTWREYDIEYTDAEIDDVWDCIVVNALYMLENGLVDMEAA